VTQAGDEPLLTLTAIVVMLFLIVSRIVLTPPHALADLLSGAA
jgi:hypothetical protein